MFGISRLEIYGVLAGIMLLIAGGCYWYYDWSEEKIATLQATVTIQTTRGDTLDADVKSLQTQMATIKSATDQATAAISQTRDLAAAASRAVRNQNLAAIAKTNPRQLETQVNSDLATSFKSLEGASHAH